VSTDLTAAVERAENDLARAAMAVASQTQKFAAGIVRREPVEAPAQALTRNALHILRLAARVDALRAAAGTPPRFTTPKDNT
jgi:hypothetical protein